MNVAYDVINQGYYDVIYEKSSKTVTKNALKYFIGGLTLINVYESYYMTNGMNADDPKNRASLRFLISQDFSLEHANALQGVKRRQHLVS